MHQERIRKIIDDFKKALESQGIKADKLILFGSYAKGVADKYSDIDLVVISTDFAKMDFQQRCEILGKAIVHVMEPIEPLAYTPEEFEKLSAFNVAGIITKNESEYAIV
jgi:predicted nucleotidyltransferase